MSTITVRNIGPVTEFEYELASPGVHVLRGHHGAGKSTILRTVQLVVDGRTDIRPTKRDGAKTGEAEVAGRSLRINRQVREEGELGVDGLGDLNIADLHTPKFVDPVTRDRHRIKTLVRLAGVKPDVSLFHDLFGGGGGFDAVVPADAMQTDDLVEMAARVKRAAERAALAAEEQKMTLLANAQAKRAAADGVDLNAPCDHEGLQAALASAVERQHVLRNRRAFAADLHSRAAHARERLASIDSGAEMSPAECQEACADATARVAAKRDCVQQAEAALASARLDLQLAIEHQRHAEEIYAAAQRHSALTAAWKADIAAAASAVGPGDSEIAEADRSVAEASAAIAEGIRVRHALAAIEESGALAQVASRHNRRAESLRDAARCVQDVLTDAIARIPDCPLRVETNRDGEPRLVIATDRSASEPFDDLSDGEKWPHIIRLAAGRNRLIVLPQAAFGELSPATQQQLHQLAIQHECFVLTAQVDDGPLRAEIYPAAPAEKGQSI